MSVDSIDSNFFLKFQVTLARATVTEQMAQLLRDIHASMLEKWVSLFFPTFSVLTELIFGFFLLFFCFCAAPPKCRTSTRRSSTTSATSFRRWTRRTSSWRPSAATRRARTRSRRSRRGNSIVVHSALVGGPSVSFHVVFFFISQGRRWRARRSGHGRQESVHPAGTAAPAGGRHGLHLPGLLQQAQVLLPLRPQLLSYRSTANQKKSAKKTEKNTHATPPTVGDRVVERLWRLKYSCWTCLCVGSLIDFFIWNLLSPELRFRLTLDFSPMAFFYRILKNGKERGPKITIFLIFFAFSLNCNTIFQCCFFGGFVLSHIFLSFHCFLCF